LITHQFDVLHADRQKRPEWVTVAIEEEVDSLLKLPAQIAVKKTQFLFNHEVIDQFCVETVLDSKKVRNLYAETNEKENWDKSQFSFFVANYLAGDLVGRGIL
jgi:hypothetical protein